LAQTKTVIGVFGSEHKAERAVEELRRSGFSDNEISVVGPDRRRGDGAQHGATMGHDVSDGGTWGAGIGGAAGLLATAGALAIPGFGPVLALGPLAATLTAAAGGGLAGALVDFGIPENQSRHYEQEVKAGKFLAVLKTDKDAQKAERCLREQGAADVRID
jgi:uncharacterized membrane protein